MIQTVSPKELADLVAAHQVDLVDVRNPEEWDTGHIEGSRLVPLPQLQADPDIVLSKTRPIVFICAKGVRSLAAAKLADRFGYTNLYSLEGGTKEWSREGLPLVTANAALPREAALPHGSAGLTDHRAAA